MTIHAETPASLTSQSTPGQLAFSANSWRKKTRERNNSCPSSVTSITLFHKWLDLTEGSLLELPITHLVSKSTALLKAAGEIIQWAGNHTGPTNHPVILNEWRRKFSFQDDIAIERKEHDHATFPPELSILKTWRCFSISLQQCSATPTLVHKINKSVGPISLLQHGHGILTFKKQKDETRQTCAVSGFNFLKSRHFESVKLQGRGMIDFETRR